MSIIAAKGFPFARPTDLPKIKGLAIAQGGYETSTFDVGAPKKPPGRFPPLPVNSPIESGRQMRTGSKRPIADVQAGLKNESMEQPRLGLIRRDAVRLGLRARAQVEEMRK